MKKALLFLLVAFFFVPAAAAQQNLDTLSLKSIFFEPLLAGRRPDFVRFSPQDERVFFTANDSAMKQDELFSVGLRGKHVRREKEKDFKRDYRLSPDGNQLVYTRDGNIWLANADFSHARALVSSPADDSNAKWGPKGRKLAYIQNGDVWIINVAGSGLRQVTHKDKKTPGYTISGWAGPNKLILLQYKLILLQYDRSEQKTYYFPEYIHKYVQPGGSRRGFAKKIVSVARLDSSKLSTLYTGKQYVSLSTSSDGKYLAMDRRDKSRKKRIIKIYDLQSRDSATVFRDSTRGWLRATRIAFAPEDHTLMIKSERDGWNHIYITQAGDSTLKELGHGAFEVPWARWIDNHKIVFASTKEGPGERQIYTADTRSGKTKKLTSTTGFREQFHLSKNKTHLIYKYSYFNQPWELYALDLTHPDKEYRLTHTIPKRFKKIDWQKPDYIRFTARDDTTKVSMTVLKPRHLKKGRKYPLVVFVHGAGTLQNVFRGWSNHYYREYMFNQFLTVHGYFVMQVDYRQSLGYGRKFREDVTGGLGKYETHDIVDGINYLAGHYAQADTSRTGIYGGSYGGFMSLYAISTAPQHFDAAAALRAVTDWKNYYYYNPWYTRPRLGTPEADSANYARSSPLTYVDSLKQPVLLLQGLRDRNVGFKDMTEYVHRLIESHNKHFQMMMYPSQRHSFTDPDDWYDEYSRIYNFFEENLK